MLKKGMLYLMVLLTVSRFSALAFVLTTDQGRLPAAVYLSCACLILFGIYLICRWIVSSVKKRDLSNYYLFTAIAVVFNLFYIKTFCRLEVSMVDFLIIGTIMDILVAITLVVSAAKERKYVKIPVQSGR